ncbi:hypothetical protein [uncultured Gimesia sp.]|uniref:hypothetical protein n=1 Tax=uncultured Gimesia sp. TaxID=1678688 RepID=UPI0026357DBC|nr:hypothetical protein [uncultured Gimesia sp.]
MFNKLFSACLISVISLWLLTSGFAADPKLKAAASVEVHTLQLQGMELKGEEIDYKVQRDGKHEISLRGQSGIKIDEMVMTADSIHVTYLTYSKKASMVLDLKGNVEIVSKGDRLRAKAMEAKLDLGAKSLTLNGGEEQDALLVRYNGPKTTHMEATEIQIQFQDQNLVLINSSGPVEISERKATKQDDIFSPQPKYNSQKTLGVPQSDKFDPSPFSDNRIKTNPFSSPKAGLFAPAKS